MRCWIAYLLMVFSDLVNIGTGRSRSQVCGKQASLSLDLSKSFDLDTLRYAMMAKDTYSLQLSNITKINFIILSFKICYKLRLSIGRLPCPWICECAKGERAKSANQQPYDACCDV